MEPPSSVNSDQNLTTGAPVDDPLSKIFTDESYLVVTGLPDEMEGCGYVVCDILRSQAFRIWARQVQ